MILAALSLPIWLSFHPLITFYKILFFNFCLSAIEVSGLKQKGSILLAHPDISGTSMLLFNIRKKPPHYCPLTNLPFSEITFVFTVFFKTLISDATLCQVIFYIFKCCLFCQWCFPYLLQKQCFFQCCFHYLLPSKYFDFNDSSDVFVYMILWNI